MHWEVEIRPRGADSEKARVATEYDLVTHSWRGAALVEASARGYLLPGDLRRQEVERLMRDLLVESAGRDGPAA